MSTIDHFDNEDDNDVDFLVQSFPPNQHDTPPSELDSLQSTTPSPLTTISMASSSSPTTKTTTISATRMIVVGIQRRASELVCSACESEGEAEVEGKGEGEGEGEEDGETERGSSPLSTLTTSCVRGRSRADEEDERVLEQMLLDFQMGMGFNSTRSTLHHDT